MKVIVSILLFYISLQYEQASPERMNLLLVIFIIFVSWGLIRTRIGSFFWLFYIDAALLLLLDYQSRFAVNYFIHSLYFLLIIEAGLLIKRKYLNRTIVPIIVIALSKYLYFLFYQFNARSLSEALFHLFALLFILSLFHYVQLQKEERNKNELLYKELLHTHRQLKKYSEEAQQVNVLKERNRIGREIHDSVGHELTALLMQLEMSLLTLKNKDNVDKVEKLLVNARETAKNCLKETRNAVHELKEEQTNLLEEITNLVTKIQQDHGILVHFMIAEEAKQLKFTEEECATFYRVIQEGLTNAMRHSATKDISVSINVDENDHFIFTIENKVSNENLKEGFGISSMRERLEGLGGSLQIDISGGSFFTKGNAPLKWKGVKK